MIRRTRRERSETPCSRQFAISLVLIAGLLFLAFVGAPAAAAGPTLTIVAPANNVIIGNGSPVAVIYAVSDFNLTKPGTGGTPSPNEGHVVVFVDGAVTVQTSAQTVVLSLASGPHAIRLQLVADNGTALIPDVSASITVIVTQGPAGGEPGIRITYPTEGLVRGTDNSISFVVSNFALVPPGGAANVPNEGHIKVFVDGTHYQDLTEYRPVQVGLDDGSHTIRLQLVDNADRALTPDVSSTVNFTVRTGTGRTTDFLPVLAYTNGLLAVGILALLLVRHWRLKR